MRNLRTQSDFTVKRVSVEKTILTDLFIKFRVLDDAVTCQPLTLDGVPI